MGRKHPIVKEASGDELIEYHWVKDDSAFGSYKEYRTSHNGVCIYCGVKEKDCSDLEWYKHFDKTRRCKKNVWEK